MYFVLILLDLNSVQYYLGNVEHKRYMKTLIKEYMHFQKDDNKKALFQIQ